RAALGQLDDGGGGIRLGGIDRRDRSQLLREGELLVGYVDADHAGTEGGGNLHRGEADAAAAVYGDPLAGLDLRPVDHAVERRHVAAAHAGRLDEADPLGERDEVHVGVGDGGEPPVAAPRDHPRRQDRVADVVVAAPAPLARPFALAEGHEHPVALPPARDFTADGLDDAAELVAEDMRQGDGDAEPAPVAAPEVPVAATDAVRLDADDDAVRGRRRVRDVAH